jgi:lipopolysaccharide exporter
MKINSAPQLSARFFQDVLQIIVGTSIGQAIVFLFAPLLTRWFTPEQFSTFEQFSMLLNILVVLVTGKYEFAILQPKKESEARHLVILGLILSFFMSGCIGLLTHLFSNEIAEYYHNNQLAECLWLLGPTLLGMAIFNIAFFWLNRKKQYFQLGFTKAIHGGLSEPIKWGAYLFHWGAHGLIISTTLGYIAGAAYCVYLLLKDHPIERNQFQATPLITVAKTYKKFPMFSIWSSLLNRAAQWAHVGVFTHFYGIAAIGLMALCRRILFTPLNLIGNSFSQVFFQQISEMDVLSEIKTLYHRYLFKFLLLSACITILVFMLPLQTMQWIFGDPWKDSIYYLRILSIWYSLNFVISALSSITLRIHMQGISLILDLVHFLFVYGAIILAYIMDMNDYQAMIFLVTAKVIYFALNLGIVSWQLQRSIDLNSKPIS